MFPRGSLGRPSARTVADTVPVGEPRTDSVEVQSARRSSELAGPLTLPESFRDPASAWRHFRQIRQAEVHADVGSCVSDAGSSAAGLR